MTLKAFAWFSDLLVEHSETFWALFGADMEAVMAEQAPDTWDSFPLFQILNDYLRGDGEYFFNLIDCHWNRFDRIEILKKNLIFLIIIQKICEMDVSM